MGNNGSKQPKEVPKTKASHCFFFVENNQEQPQKIKLADATPRNLQIAFNLRLAPKVLKDKNGFTIFNKGGSTWSCKLETNSHYKIFQHSRARKSFTEKMEIPSALDIHCAIICSQAAQLCGFKEGVSKHKEIETVFQESGIAKYFDVICPSIYGEVQYILAKSTIEEVLFIAFGGDNFSSMMAPPTKVDMEFLKDGEEEHPRQIKGDCNEYVWRQSKSIPVELILEKFLENKIKRIVVCGHGVGGAIANTFSLRLQLKLNLMKAKDEDRSLFPELVCITFGAPRCFSKVVAEEVGQLDNFFNIINIDDPVPNLLDQAAGVANFPGFIKEALMDKIASRFRLILTAITDGIGKKDLDYSDSFMRTMNRELLKFFAENKIQSEEIIKCPFYPLGSYIICCHDVNDVESLYDAPFDMPAVREDIKQFDKWRICFTKNADLATQLLTKNIIQEPHVSQHLIESYFKMVCLSLSRNFRSCLPTENNELEPGTARSSRRSCVIDNLFKPEVYHINLTTRSTVRWKRMFIEEKRLEIVLKGKNLGFFTLSDSNFSRLPLPRGGQPVIKHISDTKIELMGRFDGQKFVSEQPTVDVATHFGTTKIQANKKEIKKIDANTLANTFVDGINPLLLLRAWQRGLSSVILTETASKESEIANNKLLCQLYKLEQNCLRENETAQNIQDYSKRVVTKGFRVLGDPDPELLEILARITESFSSDLVIEFSLVGNALSVIIGGLFALHLPSLLYRLANGNRAQRLLWAVTNPSKHSFKILRNEAFKFLFETSGSRPFFNQAESDYSSMLSLYIGALQSESNEKQEDTMASIYELEEALSKKYTELGYNGKHPKEILMEKPFKEDHNLAKALNSSKCNVLRRIQLSCDMFLLRQFLKEECYIGIVGKQDAGKSTLIKQIWGLDVGVIGYTEHTDSAHVFEIPDAKNLKVVDFPGSNSIQDYMANVIKACGGMASFLILVMTYNGDVSRTHQKEFENTEGFQLPTLMCINKCEKFFRDSEDFQSKKSVDSARERFANALKVDVRDVFFTEFLKCNPEMKDRGIADIADVKKWMERKLIELEFYKENDDELKYALNKRDISP